MKNFTGKLIFTLPSKHFSTYWHCFRFQAPTHLWITGYQSFLLSTSQSARWCFSPSPYKVETKNPLKITTGTKTFIIVWFWKSQKIRKTWQIMKSLCLGLNKMPVNKMSSSSCLKQNVYHDIKIIQDNAREVTKSFAELCRQVITSDTTIHTKSQQWLKDNLSVLSSLPVITV